MRVLVIGCCSVVCSLSFSSSAAEPPTFIGLGSLSTLSPGSQAFGVSADGSTVVGQTNSTFGSEAFRWTAHEGMVGLGDLPDYEGGPDSFRYSLAHAVSADGSVVVGLGTSGLLNHDEALRWTSEDGLVGLGFLDGRIPDSQAFGVSSDGSVVVGRASSRFGIEAFRWTPATGMVGLGDLAGGFFFSEAFAVSADGSVVVGWGDGPSSLKAFRWTAAGGMVSLGSLGSGFSRSQALGVSADGSVVVGSSRSPSGIEAFRWTAAEGMVGLGDLPGAAFESEALATNADGSTVVGRATTLAHHVAFVWDPVHGMRSLRDVLVNAYGLDLSGWDLTRATGISADGRVIVGTGTRRNSEAFRAVLPDPPVELVLTPSSSFGQVGDVHTVTAVLRAAGVPVPDLVVSFAVISGPNAGSSGTCSPDPLCRTDAQGSVSFTHVGDGGTGIDRIRGSVGALTSNLARAFWDADCNENGVADTCDVSCAGFGDDCAAVTGCGESADVGGDGVPDECNRPPDCSTARAEPDRLWPPDHRLREVSLVGVADPDGDAVTTTFTSIRQDEPVLGPGSGRHDRDAVPGSPTASVRSERSSRGDGRVYRLGFRAEDGLGGSCAGEVRVCVPHDGRRQRSCGDQGPLFDSVQIAPRE